MTVRPDPTSQPVPDAALVQAYRAGDERGAAELVARHSPSIARFLYSAGAAPSDLDDLLQETFFRAFKNLDGWRGETKLRSWLFTIASNLLKDQYRRNKGRQMLSLEDRDLPSREDPESAFTATEMEQRLYDGLKLLPRLQREVFLLRAQQGSEYNDIAEALGTTPGAARVHYHHAVKRLKEMMQ